MQLFRQGHTRASVKWEEMNNGKTEQEENISETLTNLEGESIVAFTDGAALGNPGPTGAGAAIYMNGLNSHAERLKKGICKNGNNYLGEIIGLEITLKYLAEEAEVSNRSIHIFTDCQSAIESFFGNGMPSYKARPSSPVRQDGERRTTFLAEYAFRCVLFFSFRLILLFTLILFNLPKCIDAIINNTRCKCHQ